MEMDLTAVDGDLALSVYRQTLGSRGESSRGYPKSSSATADRRAFSWPPAHATAVRASPIKMTAEVAGRAERALSFDRQDSSKSRLTFEREQPIMQRTISRTRARKGFTLVELAVVIVIIGVLAAFGVPKFLNSVEKSKAAEAFNYLSTVQSAQERFIAQNGFYATTVAALDITMPAPQYFDTPTAITAPVVTTGTPTWTLTLTRLTSSSFAYSVAWTQDGFDTANSTITTYPAICPVTINGTTAPVGP
jgi:prepilin-type N-terminal cleavage/methylation domain-containing protein